MQNSWHDGVMEFLLSSEMMHVKAQLLYGAGMCQFKDVRRVF